MTPDWNAQLVAAAISNNLPKLQEALANGADLNYQDEKTDTALHKALSNGHGDIARVLLDAGADLNIQGAGKNTALHLAIGLEQLDIAAELVEKGANLNIKNDRSATPFTLGVARGHEELALRMLDLGADIHVLGEMQTPLMNAIYNDSALLFDALLQAGVDVNDVAASGGNALYYAAHYSRAAMGRELLARGADPNAKMNDGLVPLHHAVGDLEMTRALIAAGAEVNVRTQRGGRTPLQNAAADDKLDVMRLLLAAGADVNASAYSGHSALNFAVDNGQQQAATMLLAAGADPNKAEQLDKETPLHIAVRNNDPSMTRLLLAAGADPNLKDNNNWTPILRAKDKKNNDTVKLLKAAARGRRPSEDETGITAMKRELESLPDLMLALEGAIVAQEKEAVPATVDEAVAAQPKLVLGEQTRRLLEGNQAPRAENNALETMLTQVIEDKFLAELIYRNGFGPEEAGALVGAGVNVERRYRSGPEPKWRVDLWVGENTEDLHEVVGEMADELGEKLTMRQATPGRGRKGIATDFHDNLDDIVDGFNAMLTGPIAKIDMTELRAAAKAEAQQKQPQQNQDLGRA